jgi:hypothetical protein
MHALHLATIASHREVTLDEVVKRGIKMKHARLAIADELVLKHETNIWCVVTPCSFVMS